MAAVQAAGRQLASVVPTAQSAGEGGVMEDGLASAANRHRPGGAA